MRLLLIFLSGFPFALIGVGLLRPDLLLGTQEFTTSIAWTFIGTFISYFGFVFSLYAVLEVKSLSNRYFTKQRLPEIKKQIERITKNMSASSGFDLSKIRTERFFGEIAVTIRHVKKTKIREFSDVIKRAEVNYKQMEVILKKGSRSHETANDIPEYWTLLRNLTELSDEIEAHNKGVQASL